MENFTAAQRDALAEVRFVSGQLTAAASAQRDEVARAAAVGGPSGSLSAWMGPAGVRFAGGRLHGGGVPSARSYMRRRFSKRQREVLDAIDRATNALRQVRDDQRDALRRTRASGIPIDMLAVEARVAPEEVRRVTERVPVDQLSVRSGS